MSYKRKTVRELFNEAKAAHEQRKAAGERSYFNEDYWKPNGGYEALITLGGEEIVNSVDVGDYQGDALLLLKHPTENLYFFLEYGWGSCSGCDAFQGCDTIGDLQELADSFVGDAEWKTADEMLAYFRSKNWDERYYYRDSEVQRWVNEIIQFLETLV